MTLVVLGLDALDPDIVEPETHPNLALDSARSIETIASTTGEPSTHELWPTIITGLPPAEHGLILEDDGVAWGNPVLNVGSTLADHVLPDAVQTRIGAWILTNTEMDAFRTPAEYYREKGIDTLFDGRAALPIGIPNYVLDSEADDREHALRRTLGDMFERDQHAPGGHSTSDPIDFYERCLEMAMIRIARTRRALRGGRYELVFGYTSALDLIGHVSYDWPELQRRAYEEVEEFVGELKADLREEDELVIVSDHGLQDGIHTTEAMIASTDQEIVEEVESVLDVRAAIESELTRGGHAPREQEQAVRIGDGSDVADHLKDLGYM